MRERTSRLRIMKEGLSGEGSTGLLWTGGSTGPTIKAQRRQLLLLLF